MNRSLIHDKLKAAALHLMFSLAVIGGFLLIVYFIWYPYPLYILEGLSHITVLLLGIDLVLGPLLTLILYKKGKKYLLFDLSIVIILQLSAFSYGAYTIAQARPVYIVFATDVYKTVSPTMLDMSTLKDSSLRYSLFSSPIYVYATAPDDPQKRSDLLLSILSGGKDIEQLPSYYQNYRQHLPQVRQKNQNYKDKLRLHPELQQKLINVRNEYALPNKDLGLYPLFAHEKNVIAIVNLENGQIIDYLDTFP